MSGYAVKSIYRTIQGEGAHAGRTAVFCRFAGCNLWTGREQDRANAICRFCDTDFLGVDGPGGGYFRSASDLAQAILAEWPEDDDPPANPFVVCTGGEPLLQMDDELVEALHEIGFEIALETNGSRHAPPGIDWVCVSPKAGASLVIQSGHEMKLVYPQEGAPPEDFAGLDFKYFFLQPMDGPDLQANTRAALEYCLEHPAWGLSLQVHKILGIG